MSFLKPSTLSNLAIRTLEIGCKLEPTIVVHGGAGHISDSKVHLTIQGVKEAANYGYDVLVQKGSVIDAVETAIRNMEDNEEFNAGYGSVLNEVGEVEMDASIMVGTNLNCGGVSVVKDIAHPISLARLVMEKTPHVLLVGHGANKFAKDQGIPILPVGSLVTQNAKETYEKYNAFGQSETGTIGAVALDGEGHLAAGTSTGGLNRKMIGRGSDSSKIGAGTYADDNIGAVSTTGHGESIMKISLAHSIIKSMEQGLTPLEATQKWLMYMFLRLSNTAGAIVLSRKGDVGVAFSTQQMSWACRRSKVIHFGIDTENQIVENIPST